MLSMGLSFYEGFYHLQDFPPAPFETPFTAEIAYECGEEEDWNKESKIINNTGDLKILLSKAMNVGKSAFSKIENNILLFEPMMLHNTNFLTAIHFEMQNDTPIIAKVLFENGC